uniref:Uncharacterized protein n=1 Tax=Hyaloperonospora arabidopsidis (strain Emoy2) TaxID=559515 RepID=M4BA75_HYAAE
MLLRELHRVSYHVRLHSITLERPPGVSCVAPTSQYWAGSPANERSITAFPSQDWIARASLHAQAEDRNVLGYALRPTTSTFSINQGWRYIATKLYTWHWSCQGRCPSRVWRSWIASKRSEVSFPSWLMTRARYVTWLEAAESLAKENSSTVAGFSLRFERLKKSNPALRHGNEVLKGLRYSDRLRLHSSEDHGTRPR